MEHENELKEALDFVSPSALTYDEWLMVGMALKDAGLPVTPLGTVEHTRCRPLSQGRVCQEMGKLSRRRGQPRHRKQHFSAGLLPTDGAARRATLWTGTMIFLPAPAHKGGPGWKPGPQAPRSELCLYVTESFMAADRRRPAKAAGPAPQGSSSPSWMPAAVTSARWWATVILK